MSKETNEAELRVFEHGGADYALALSLRTRVLREPLGLKYDPADLAREKDDIHLGLFEGERIVGCLILAKQNDRSVKMRQMAVDPEIQGQGVGRQLVAHAEKLARELGYDEMVLNARETAIPFYRNLGYLAIDEPFVEVGLPHRKMIKTL